jgi:predicted HAD superfamily Cof-like phosphohydrolase
MIAMIAEFHEKFGLAYNEGPRQLPTELKEFRIKFLLEELTEYVSASFNENKAEQLDALIDIVYIALGTAYLQGFDFAEGFKRVHEANMKKVRATEASQSLRKSTLDIVKPKGWQVPDLTDLV